MMEALQVLKFSYRNEDLDFSVQFTDNTEELEMDLYTEMTSDEVQSSFRDALRRED